ncbi:MAG: transposase [Geminicoccaceae bacterium]
MQPLRRDRWQRLAALRTGDGRALPPRLAAALGRELKRLELGLEMITALEAERDAIVAAPAPAHPHAPKIQALARLKGIGPEFATVLVGEVAHRAFANRRQVARHVGLTPSPFCSGRMAREQGISKSLSSGRLPRARRGRDPGDRTGLDVAAPPARARSANGSSSGGAARGRRRRIAAAALARKLLVALWRYLETGLVPDGAVLKG